MFFVYVLQNPKGRLYIGCTENLELRVEQHQAGEGGWTRYRGPWRLVHSEAYADHAEALRRERTLKGGRQNQDLRKHFSLGPPEKDKIPLQTTE